MDRRVDLARKHRGVDLLGEKPLSARLREGSVLDPVARRADDDDLEPRFLASVRGGEQTARLVGLRERERRSARANSHQGLSHFPAPSSNLEVEAHVAAAAALI